MKGTVKKDCTFKSGRVFKKGEIYDVIPPLKNAPWRSHIVIDVEEQITVSTSILGKIFKEFEPITMHELQRGAFDSVCLSVTGTEVEPDGWDEHGFPSMLLAMGMI